MAKQRSLSVPCVVLEKGAIVLVHVVQAIHAPYVRVHLQVEVLLEAHQKHCCTPRIQVCHTINMQCYCCHIC